MAKSTIKITGHSLKDPRIRKDGSTEILFKIAMMENVPKGLKSLGESMYKVLIAKRTWDRFIKNNDVDENTFYIIEGEPKASVTSKGLPYTTIVCFNIQCKASEVSNDNKINKKIEASIQVEKQSDNKPDVVKKTVTEVKVDVKKNKDSKNLDVKKTSQKNNSSKINWRHKINQDELQEIDVNKIDLDYPDHSHAFIHVGDKIGINSFIVVKEKDNGRYSLVIGYKACVSAKVYRNTQPIKAYIYNKGREAFFKEYEVEEY